MFDSNFVHSLVNGVYEMNTALERHIENKFGRHVRRRQCEYIKMNQQNDSHWPDRLIVKPDNTCFFVEFKREGKLPRPAQEAKIKDLKTRNRRVYVIDSEALMDSVLRLENLL